MLNNRREHVDQKRRTGDVARKGVLVAEYRAMVLGGHAEVLHQ